MKSFADYNQAEQYAKEVSKKEMRGVGIIKRAKGKNFIVCDNGGKDRKSHDIFVMFIHNYETPFYIESNSPKSGWHRDEFPTVQRAKKYYDEIKIYRHNIHKNF